MVAEPIAELRDLVDGVSVHITRTAYRYSVRMRDDDSNTYLPIARVYDTLDNACWYARKLMPHTGIWCWHIDPQALHAA